MIKGKELLNYTLNQIGKDKFIAIYSLVEEIANLDDLTMKAISLIDPLSQYAFLEGVVLSMHDSDSKLIEYLKSHKLPLPIKYGWKHTVFRYDKEDLVDKCERFDNKINCYCSMFEAVNEDVCNCLDCLDSNSQVIIKKDDSSFIVDLGGVKSVFEIYEM